MTAVDLGPTGAVLSPAEDGYVDTAVELERLGYSTIWLSGGPMSSLSQITEVVRATTTVRVATAIIPVDTFASDDVASLYTELEREHPGRFVVGLGGAHGADPLATLNGYLDRLDGVIPQDRRVMAALGPRMLELAREHAAGALPVLITPAYAAQARATLGADMTLAVEQLGVVETNPDHARAIARGPLGFLGRVPAYQASFRRMGFSQDDITALGDTLVDAVVAWGGVDAIAARVGELRAAGTDHVTVSIVSTSAAATHAEWAAVAGALIE
ncbi:MAG: TIGR03620 family F420-dependent LLM class oxidoreductase [Acidimicrobiales bacterium]